MPLNLLCIVTKYRLVIFKVIFLVSHPIECFFFLLLTQLSSFFNFFLYFQIVFFHEIFPGDSAWNSLLNLHGNDCFIYDEIFPSINQ